MELKQVNFGYSLKNIPTPSKRIYLKSMISKLEHFIKRLRWRAFFHDHKAECDIYDKDVNLSSNFVIEHFESTDFYTVLHNILAIYMYIYISKKIDTKISVFNIVVTVPNDEDRRKIYLLIKLKHNT